MAMRLGTTLIPTSLFCLAALLASPAQAGPLRATFAPVAEALGAAVCIDPWRKTRPCRPAASLPGAAAHRTDQANRWLLSLWSAAEEGTAGPRLILSGKRASCGAAYDTAPLVKFDFTRFQVNMDIDMDADEERLDTIRLAYRSCWR
ncbi:MAG: hypothetical protein AB7Q01_13925 [Gammaproteobacteria bacterium]